MLKENENLKIVKKHDSIGACSRYHRPMRDDRDQYLMKDISRQKWHQEDESFVHLSRTDLDSKRITERSSSAEESVDRVSDSSEELAAAHNRTDDETDKFTGLRRKSCTCT